MTKGSSRSVARAIGRARSSLGRAGRALDLGVSGFPGKSRRQRVRRRRRRSRDRAETGDPAHDVDHRRRQGRKGRIRAGRLPTTAQGSCAPRRRTAGRRIHARQHLQRARRRLQVEAQLRVAAWAWAPLEASHGERIVLAVDVELHGAVPRRPAAPRPCRGTTCRARNPGNGMVRPCLAAAMAAEPHERCACRFDLAAMLRRASRAARTVSKPITPQSS